MPRAYVNSPLWEEEKEMKDGDETLVVFKDSLTNFEGIKRRIQSKAANQIVVDEQVIVPAIFDDVKFVYAHCEQLKWLKLVQFTYFGKIALCHITQLSAIGEKINRSISTNLSTNDDLPF